MITKTESVLTGIEVAFLGSVHYYHQIFLLFCFRVVHFIALKEGILVVLLVAAVLTLG